MKLVKMKARVTGTTRIIDVADHGKEIYPRYWSEGRGYNSAELQFLDNSTPEAQDGFEADSSGMLKY